MGRLPERKPWPMKWVILAIALFVVGYTVVMLRYRKPNPAYQPYQDSVDRATVSRLLEQGFRRVQAEVSRPLEGKSAPATQVQSLSVPGGLDEGLSYAFAEKPSLVAAFTPLSLPAQSRVDQPYVIRVKAQLSDLHTVVGAAHVMIKDKDIWILPTVEPLAGKLEARWKEAVVELSIPAGTLPEGQLQATLLGAKESRKWTLQVRR